MEGFFTPTAVATVGFPIVMCIWLIRSGQQTISDNTRSNTELTKAILKLTEAVSTQSTRLDHFTDGLSRIDGKVSHLTELFVEHKTKFEQSDH